MQIVIDVVAYYDWEPMPGIASENDILAMRAKPGQNGQWLKKVTKQQPSYTTINLPESEIENCMTHFEKIGNSKTRAQVVMWYLTEKVMMHHAHQDHWTKITVHDDPEIEMYLNKCLITDGK